MTIFNFIGVVLAGFIAISSISHAANPQMENIESMTQMTESNKTKEVVVTRTFDAPVEEVWKYWTDSEKVRKWWGPKGFTAPIANMDFRVGGKTLVCMRAPREFGGLDMYNTWTYTKIVPMERIEFVLNFADKDANKLDPAKMGLPPGIPMDVPHVITFRTLDSGKTEMTVTEYGYASRQSVDLSKAGLEECLDKMAGALK